MKVRIAWLAGLAVLVAALLLWWSGAPAPERAPVGVTPGGRPEPTREASSSVAEAQVAVQREPVGPATAPSPDGLAPGAAVRDFEVLVRDELEQPVPGASIVLSRDGGEWLSEAIRPEKAVGTTDAAGRALLTAVPDEMAFVAAVKVHVGASAFRLISRETRAELTIATCDTEVRGRVVDHLDQGVVGAEVELSQRWGFVISGAARQHDPYVCPVRRHTTTAADGSFVFGASRTWGLCTVAARLGRIACRSIAVDPVDEAARHLRLELPGRVLLRGEVLDWRGLPVPQCEVWAECAAKAPDPAECHQATTDAVGRFELPFLAGGPCDVVPLGNPTSPAGPAVKVELTPAAPGWVHLRTAEPASQDGITEGLLDDRQTRVMARPVDDNVAGMHELNFTGNGEFVLRGLMKGVAYNVFAFQGDDQLAHATVTAGDGSRIVLRSKKARGDCVVLCELGGEGVPALATAYVRIAAFELISGPEGTQLGDELATGDWQRPGTVVRLARLPACKAAVAVVLANQDEVARSEPFALSSVPANAVIELRRSGTIEITATIAEGTMVHAQVLRGDAVPILREGAVRMRADRPFRRTLPAGHYVVRITTSDAAGSHAVVDLPCVVVADQTTSLRAP